MKARQLLVLLCLAVLACEVKEVTSQARCSVPQWPSIPGIAEQNPVELASGKVLLVALMKGYCRYCWYQAQNLESLKAHMWNRGFRDIEMIIVNGGSILSRTTIGNYAHYTNLTIYQDTEDNTLYNLFGGDKDDFIFYNRCGQRAAFLPHPYSYLGRTYTERVLRALHRGRSRCVCNLDPAPQSRGRRSAEYWKIATSKSNN
ncbi:selenoprotein P [Elysia marginata]|uniref:Selenoprotein P n=1 Tax=Elysia marginata TaxID=1093978 RepID=A0AAV4EDV6_9GAST|nr:selenoprotein P [Elysia marginata]